MKIKCPHCEKLSKTDPCEHCGFAEYEDLMLDYTEEELKEIYDCIYDINSLTYGE